MSETNAGQALTLWGQEYDIELVADRLDAAMMVIKACKEETCRDPWGSLHPDGSVKNFQNAMASKFNAFYRESTKVSYTKCEGGYILSSEGPQEYDVFGDEELNMRGLGERDWSLWE